MNRSPDEVINALAFAALNSGGSVSVLLGDNEIARLVLAWREMAAKEAVSWQPIETAPKDGTTILAAKVGKDGCELVFWNDECWWDAPRDCWQPGWDTGRGGRYGETPTHWMRLPELANAAQSQT